jgi:ubiquitin-conjugating enzyme E2 J1
MTPSGRFEANREICLSISGHHEETWQPAWGVRTALVAYVVSSHTKNVYAELT